jgi:hypothetical protein
VQKQIALLAEDVSYHPCLPVEDANVDLWPIVGNVAALHAPGLLGVEGLEIAQVFSQEPGQVCAAAVDVPEREKIFRLPLPAYADRIDGSSVPPMLTSTPRGSAR